MLDDLSSGKRENLEGALAAGARLHEGDVADPAAVDAAFADATPEQVFHLAAQIDVRRSVSRPGLRPRRERRRHDQPARGGGARRDRADSCSPRRAARSTARATGRDLPLAEDAECRPDAPYGQSKLAAEGYLDLYARLHGLSTVALRLGNVYGPRQDPHGEAGVVAIFCGALLDGATPKVFGDGKQTRDYIYVDDVVAAFLAASESRRDRRLQRRHGPRGRRVRGRAGRSPPPTRPSSSPRWPRPRPARCSGSRSRPAARPTSSAGGPRSSSRTASPARRAGRARGSSR